MIELTFITKKYGDRTVLDNLNFSLAKGDYVSIIGNSGVGKSTLLNILGLLDSDFFGVYSYFGRELRRSEYSHFRNEHIGFVFQQYNLIPSLSAKDNVLLPYSFCEKEIAGINSRCDMLFDEFGMSDFKNQEVKTLSGGEKQRVALIRSVILNPEIILADEPTGNLDAENTTQIRFFLRNMHEQGKTVVVVTHDVNFAEDASRKFKLLDGKLYESS